MTITKRRTSWLISSVWFLSFLSALPPLLGVSRIEYRPSWRLCSVLWLPGDICAIIYSLYLCTVGFALPFVKMVWIYCSMFRAAQRSSARARQHSLNSGSIDSSESFPQVPASNPSPNTSSAAAPASDNPQNTPSFNRRRFGVHAYISRRRSSCSQSFVLGEEWKAARTGIIILLSFFLCWFPFFATALAEPWVNPENMPAFVPTAATLLALSASLLDPYIYVFRNRAVRKQLRKMFWCFKSSSKTLLQKREAYASDFVGCSMTSSFRERNHLWTHSRPGMHIVHAPKVLNDIMEVPSSLQSPSPPIQDSILQGPKVDLQTSNVCGDPAQVLRTITNPCEGIKGETSFEEELISIRSTDGLLFLKMRRANRDSSTLSDSTLNWGSSCDSGGTIEDSVQRGPGELVRVRTLSATSRSSSGKTKPILRRSRTVEEQDMAVVLGAVQRLPYGTRPRNIRMQSEDSTEASCTSAESQDTGGMRIVVRTNLTRPPLVRQSQASDDPVSSVDEDEEVCYVIAKTSL